MKENIFIGKTKEEAVEKALTELKTTEDSIIIKVLSEKQGIIKKEVKIEVIKINDVITYLKDSLKEITKLMNIESNLEVKRREKNIIIEIYSDKNSILIGKNGKNLEALQNIIRQIIPQEVNNEYKIVLDIENYKDRKISNLERMAKQVAREVKLTKVETKLEPMNSYERRAIHNILTNNKYVYTESVGEEPNRCVVIKPKEEKKEDNE